MKVRGQKLEHRRSMLIEDSYLNTVMKGWKQTCFCLSSFCGTGRGNQDLLLVVTGV